MHHRVIAFEQVGDYTLHLTFDNGRERTIDFEPILLGPLFGALQDKALFSAVQLDESFGTLEWPNGADIAPTVLYDWLEHVAAIVARRQKEMMPLEN